MSWVISWALRVGAAGAAGTLVIYPTNAAPQQELTTDVVVVGAGVSGLACAAKLRESGKRVVVLEASYHPGGRIRSVNELEFSSFGGEIDSTEVVPAHHRQWLRVHRPLAASNDLFGTDDYAFEIGAEFIHGPASDMTKEIVAQGIPFHELFTWAHGDGGPSEEPSPDGGIGMYWHGESKRLMRFDQLDSDQKHMIETLGNLSNLSVDDRDTRSLGEYLSQAGVTPDAIRMAEAGYANTVGGTLAKISLARMARCERNWLNDGEGDYRVSENRTLHSLIQGLARKVDVRIQTPVHEIQFNEASKTVKVLAKTKDGNLTVTASSVVVTVPMPVLQKQLIHFTPSLPESTVEAINSLECEPALKIIAKFRSRFWPKNLQGCVCSNSFVPELWFDGRHAERGPYYVTAFYTSDQARSIACTPTDAAFNEVKHQLKEMFGTEKANSEYLGGFIIDWAAVPNIWGGYTTPSLRELPHARTCLSTPHFSGLLHFAGEATDPTSFMTAHAAMKTGLRAAANITNPL